jgi:o-succinylbenzoate synthase
VKRSLFRLSIPLREPFVTAAGVVSERELLLLRLEEEGVTGHGEAAPFEPFDGTTVEQVAEALTEPSGETPPHARSAREMAMMDLAARQKDRPIGEPGAEKIAVNLTLPAGPAEEVAERAKEGAARGYSCFKLKVGLPDDAERVAAVRSAIGSWPALRVDANGAWTVPEAVESIEALKPYDLELVEQPCRTLEELAQLRRKGLGVPIAADEPIATVADVREAAALEACDAVNVKLAPSGGFTAARYTVRAAKSAGLEPYLSSNLDGPWGIAAALRLAASEDLSLACGLATLELFDSPIARAIPPPAEGLLAVPQGPGLGVEVDEVVLHEVVVEELAA